MKVRTSTKFKQKSRKTKEEEDEMEAITFNTSSREFDDGK